MTKRAYLLHIAALYRVANRSDDPNKPADEAWTRPAMAALAGYVILDNLLANMADAGVISEEERQAFYDDL